MPAKTTTATIGQYSDYCSFSDMSELFTNPCAFCGQSGASWSYDGTSGEILNFGRAFCDGCRFRMAVMKAAGREEEFWKAVESRNTYKYEFRYINAKDSVI